MESFTKLKKYNKKPDNESTLEKKGRMSIELGKINTFKRQRKTIFLLVAVLLSLSLVSSCKETIRAELVGSLKGETLEGFNFATLEDGNQIIASLTNSEAQNIVTLENNTINKILKYTLVKENINIIKRVYKTEVIKKNSELALVVTDITTGIVVSRTPFPESKSNHSLNGLHNFDTFEECIADFNCTSRQAYQCEANRTCEVQLPHLLCCFNDGQCFSLVMIINPTRLKCRLGNVAMVNQGVFVIKGR